jgi:hypothetical protein
MSERWLIGCEYSARIRDAMRARGVDAWSCDLLPCDGDPRWHIQGDVLDQLDQGWDGAVFHPPCPRLTNTAVQFLHSRNLWAEMRESAAFFRALLHAPIAKVAVENPIPHRYAVAEIGQKYTQLVQPYMFGHRETKATCLWLRGLPKLVPTSDLKAETMALPKRERMRLHYLPPSPDRAKLRSLTYQGIADAIAEQWT